jgi:hypothetical protein
VKRFLAVYSNKTDALLEEYEFKRFDLSAFQQHFGFFNDDPLMYYDYPISREDTEFVSKYLLGPITFDFDQYSYFVSCYEQTEEQRGVRAKDGV